MAIKAIVKGLWKDPFSRYLIIALLVLGAYLMLAPAETTLGDGNFTIDYFFSPTCPHCADQKPFNEYLADTYPITIVKHDITNLEEAALLRAFAENYSIEHTGVPATFFKNISFVGFETVNTTGKKIETALQRCLEGNCTPVEQDIKWGCEEGACTTEEEIPFLGDADVEQFSLLGLSVILGLIDGFNPCAMWVLVFLISLMMGLKDKRKLWLLVGSFVAASGILYFLFMTAWLNVFLFIGYLKPVTILVGLIALGAGILEAREWIKNKGQIACKVGDAEEKRQIMDKMRAIVQAPLTWATVGGIIVLAFMVNAIEFACSAVIPVVFTQTLTLHNLTPVAYYFYMLVYVLFFMLDDLIIFGLAAFAITHVGDKYMKWCKPIGAIILLALGYILLFAPHLLH